MEGQPLNSVPLVFCSGFRGFTLSQRGSKCSRSLRRSTLVACSCAVPSAPHQPEGDDDRHDDDQETVGEAESVVCGCRGSSSRGHSVAGNDGEVGHVDSDGDRSAVLDRLAVEGHGNIGDVVSGTLRPGDCVGTDSEVIRGGLRHVSTDETDDQVVDGQDYSGVLGCRSFDFGDVELDVDRVLGPVRIEGVSS